MRICKNDQVQVIAGKEKGKTGKVLSVDLKHGRIVIEKINMVTRHTKPTQKNPQGGIVQKEQSVHYSNVLLFCPKCNKGVRFGTRDGAASKKSKDGSAKKVRVCRKCDSELKH